MRAFSSTKSPSNSSAFRPTLSYQRLHTQQILNDRELYEKIRKSVQNKHELQVLESFLIFNKHVLKTNFYQPTKVALSFRLAPDFLPEVEYPKKPFGMFFIIGKLRMAPSDFIWSLTSLSRERVPRVPYSLQGCRSGRYPYRHVKEQRVSLLNLPIMSL